VAITWEQIEGRIHRLNALTMGLGREVVAIEEHDDPLLYVERREYLQAILQALSGVESARVVLAKARQGHRDEAAGK
jgi:hypothetical protein